MSKSMKTTCRIFSHSEMPGRTTAGGVVDISHGCNGVVHADCFHEIFHDNDGKVEHANPLTTIVIGVCDKSCGTEDKGFFSL